MTELQTWFATLGLSVVSALVPVVNAELLLLGAVALAPREWAIPLALASALGQIAGKVLMYYVGRGALRLPGERARRAVAKAEAQLTKHQGMENAVYFSSALLGFPPYYLVAVASGVVHYPLPRFILLGFVGRFLRFAVVALFPGWVKGMLG